MKKIQVIIFLLISLNLNANESLTEKLYAKPTIPNLRYRDIPFLAGNKLGLLNMEWYEVIDTSRSKESIDGMSSYWVQIRIKDSYVWAYGGYLELSKSISIDQLPEILESNKASNNPDILTIKYNLQEIKLDRNRFIGFDNDPEIIRAYSNLCGTWYSNNLPEDDDLFKTEFSWGLGEDFVGAFTIDMDVKGGHLSTGPVGAFLHSVEKTNNYNEYLIDRSEFGDLRRTLSKVIISKDSDNNLNMFFDIGYIKNFVKLSGPNIFTE